MVIADSVEQYLCGRDSDIGPIPDREPVEEKPEPLVELERFEFYDWRFQPREGGLYDQPYHFMEELRAAAEGRARYRLLTMQPVETFNSDEPEKPGVSFDLQDYFGMSKENAS